MNYSSYRISLDNYDTSSQIVLNAKQGDTGRKIYISLTDGSTPYHIENGCRAIFTAEKPDGTLIYNDCVIEEDIIIYTLTEQTTAAAGFVACEIKLYDENDILLISPRFGLLVEESVFNDKNIAESGHELNAVVDIVEKAVDDYLEENPVAIDATLTRGGYAADAKTTGDRFSTIEKKITTANESISNQAKVAAIKTYTAPAQFGCTAASTPAEIRAALPNGSVFMCLPEELTNEAWNFPSGVYLLQMFKANATSATGNAARVKTLLLGKRLEFGDYQADADEDGVPTGTWYRMPRMLTATVTLSAGGWSNGEQTVNAAGVSAKEEGNAVIPSPAPASFLAYQEANVRISQQGSGTLTFTCDETPTTALTVNILILR